MTRMVCGFMFDQDRSAVVLLEKQRPAWQQGRYNGVGGKIEPGENQLDAMVREFKEETGVETMPFQWSYFAVLAGRDFEVHFFYAANQTAFEQARTVEAEEIHKVQLVDLHDLRWKTIPNLQFLIPLARTADLSLTGSKLILPVRLQEA